MFPVFAGGMLLGLYAVIKFFGKDTVNSLILVYIAFGGSQGMKAALQSLTGGLFDSLDQAKLVDLKDVKWVGDIVITQLDLVGFLLSVVSVIFYVWSKSWVYNNILAVVFCVHAL